MDNTRTASRRLIQSDANNAHRAADYSLDGIRVNNSRGSTRGSIYLGWYEQELARRRSQDR